MATSLAAQVFPAEGAALHYRIVGFSMPPANGRYKLSIARGYITGNDSFAANMIISRKADGNRLVVEVPDWGADYTWQYSCTSAGQRNTGPLYHFSTRALPLTDTARWRLRIINHARSLTDCYFLLDGNKVMYDLNGAPVWFLPDVNGSSSDDALVRDLKPTSFGTLTLLVGRQTEARAAEIDYNGHTLWQPPSGGEVSGDSTEHYHHEFTRLSDGTYLLLGNEYIPFRPLPTQDSILIDYNKFSAGDNSGDPKLAFGTLLRYNKDHKMLWSWRSADYFKMSDIHYHTRPFYMDDIDVHANSCSFDERSNTCYISFRNISRIIKIAYPSGAVLNVWGETFRPGAPVLGNPFFSGQHSCVATSDDAFWLMNNNIRDTPSAPEVVRLQPDSSAPFGLIRKQSFRCDTTGSSWHDDSRFPFLMGGNVTELPHDALFVCVPGISKLYIRNSNGKIIWSAIPEKKDETTKDWKIVPQYRASVIYGREAMEKLIFGDK